MGRKFISNLAGNFEDLENELIKRKREDLICRSNNNLNHIIHKFKKIFV